MDRNQRTSLAIALRQRYQESRKAEKSSILDEFVAVTGFHRKYATRVLLDPAAEIVPARSVAYKKVYDEAVKETLIVLGKASDRICGKRLKAIIPVLLASLEGHNRLKLDAEVRERVLASVSVSHYVFM
ncbi:hypothetical protein [Aureliella helgolandensis]|uniref:Uncharacterized protein n=1 Tax=Aureliella helgolandensis TaxID=2527968 RepID=A0A518GB07_9BACT|nr:hypothetical protein [Aureliella helgolandensis]QDV25795.1 hypothetical protein Q31a_41220 [Aureliella helgolandensis]